MIPQDVDYSYESRPTHLATNFNIGDKQTGIHFDQYFGGVTLFPMKTFEKVNGYSNEYWGWGFEDDDLFHRVLQSGIKMKLIKKPNYVSSTASLVFDGENSNVKFNNIIDYKKDFSIFISLKVGNIKLDPEKDSDRYTVFHVPGYDFTVTYNSFKRFEIAIFDRKGNIHTINSEIATKKHSKIILTWSEKEQIFSAYLDNNLIGRNKINFGLYNYKKSPLMHLGYSNPKNNTFVGIHNFIGNIDSFATYDCVLSKSEINSLVTNSVFGLTTGFDNYKSTENLTTYYDPKIVRFNKLVDLSGKNNPATIENCWIEPTDFTQYRQVYIPHRKECYFTLLEHEPGGYSHGKWKDQLTRFNQLKYVNEASTGYLTFLKSGLNNITYKINSDTQVEREVHLNVGL